MVANSSSGDASPESGGDGKDLPLVSVVVPVRNEGPNILPLIAEIEAAMAAFPHEIIYVDDGSDDETPAVLAGAAASSAAIRPLCHTRSC